MSERLTASKLFRANICPASFSLPSVTSVSSVDEATERGTVIHKFLENSVTMTKESALQLVTNKDWNMTCSNINLEEIYGNSLTIEPEVSFSFNIITGEASKIGTYRTNRGTFIELNNNYILGTADLILIDKENNLKVIDYKTGYSQVENAENNLQLKFLALCAKKVYNAATVTASLAYIQEDGFIIWNTSVYTDIDIEDSETVILRIWLKINEEKKKFDTGKTPSVTKGSHCRYCPAMSSCPAFAALAKQLANPELEKVLNISVLTKEEVGIAWQRIKHVKKILDEIEPALKARILREPVVLDTGKVLRPVEVTRESIIVNKAIDILKKYATDEEIDRIVDKSINKKDIEDILGKEKSKEVFLELKTKNAINRYKITSIREQSVK